MQTNYFISFPTYQSFIGWSLLLWLLTTSLEGYGQTPGVGIGTTEPNDHAILHLVSPMNNQGLLVPQLTTDQREDLSFSNTEKGLLVFDTEKGKFYYWGGSAWVELGTDTGVWRSGTDDPVSTIGNNGDFYLRMNSGNTAQILKKQNGEYSLIMTIGNNSAEDLTLAAGHILIGGQNNKAAARSIDGDARLASSGELTIKDGAISTGKIANGAITADKLAQMGATNGQVLKWNGSNWAPGTDATGSGGNSYTAGAGLTLNNNAFAVNVDPNTLEITNDIVGVKAGGINTNQLANGAVTADKLGSDANVDANRAVTTNHIRNSAVTVAKIGTAGPSDANKVLTTNSSGTPQWENKSNFASSSLPNGQILVGSTSNEATPVSMSQDASINNEGEVTVQGLQGKPIAASTATLASADNGKVLTWNGTSNPPQWEAAAPSTGTIGQITLDRTNAPISNGSNNTISVTGKTYLELREETPNGNNNNSQVTLGNGTDGQVLIIVSIGNVSIRKGNLFVPTGVDQGDFVRLTNNDTMQLIWNASAGRWLLISIQDNANQP